MDFQKRLLRYLGVGEKEALFLLRDYSLDDLPSLDGFEATKKAISLVDQAKEKGEGILVYGDYDCDGATSTAILARALSDYGAKVRFYLPSRYLDGYGLNEENAKSIVKSGLYSLIITVDNGIAALSPIEILKEAGLSVVVIDHHERGKELPKADAIIHPETLPYPSPSVSAGYLAYQFSRALLKKSVPYLLTLGALSTVSDMMELRGHNRAIVKLAEEALAEGSFPALLSLLPKKEGPVSYRSFALSIAPAVNAVGRLEEEKKVSRIASYLEYGDKGADPALLAYVLALNEKRKAISSSFEELSFDASLPAITALSPYPEGLNGLIANRLLEAYGRPAAVFSPKKNDPEVLVGSLRSKEGCSIISFYDAGRVSFLTRGGHELAAGASIENKDLDLFKQEFGLFALAHPFKEEERPPMEVGREDLTLENLAFLEKLSPFGSGFKEPHFRLPGVLFDELAFAKDGKYLSFPLGKDSRAFSFRLGSRDFEPGKRYALEGTFERDVFRGRSRLTFKVERASEEK